MRRRNTRNTPGRPCVRVTGPRIVCSAGRKTSPCVLWPLSCARSVYLSVCLSPWNGLGARQAMEEEGRTQQRWHAEAEARRGDEVRELRLRSEAQLAAMRSQLAQLEVSFPRPPFSRPRSCLPRRLVCLASPLPLWCVSVVSLLISRVCLSCLSRVSVSRLCVFVCSHVRLYVWRLASKRA